MKAMRLFSWFFIALPALSTQICPLASAQNAKEQSIEIINIAELLRESETGRCQTPQERASQLENYTFKTDSEKEKILAPDKQG